MNLELLQHEAETEVKDADIIVDDQPSMEIASEIVIKLDDMKKKVVEFFADPKSKAYAAWKSITEKEKEMLSPIEGARDALKRKVNAYLTEQKRIEDERRRQAEEERRRLEEEERQRLEAEKLQLEAEGKGDEAEAVAEAIESVYIPPEVPDIVVPKTTRTDSGIVSGKEEIAIEIRDKKALIEALVSEGLLDLVEIKEAKLKQYIKLKALETFPGLGIQKIVSASFRGKKVS
jgi:hypothetical protein